MNRCLGRRLIPSVLFAMALLGSPVARAQDDTSELKASIRAITTSSRDRIRLSGQ